MKSSVEKIRAFVLELKQNIIPILLTGLILLGVYLLNIYAPSIPIIALGAAFAILVLVLWFKAGKIVFDSLIEVAATAGIIVSIVLFLTQSYCDLPIEKQTATQSLVFLYSFGLMYALYRFGSKLWENVNKDVGDPRNSHFGKWWILLIYLLLIILFLWQFYEVLDPIIHRLCIFKQ